MLGEGRGGAKISFAARLDEGPRIPYSSGL
jgi:hypothetical protein